MSTGHGQNKTTGDDFDDLTLAKIAAFLRANLKSIACFSIVGIIIGIGLTFLIPKQWEGQTTLLIGRIGSLSTMNTEPQPIEPIVQAAGRVSLPAFRDTVAGSILPNEKDDLESLHQTTVWNQLKGRAVPNTSYVEISARGDSRQQAIDALKVASDLIIQDHAKRFEAARAVPEQQLKEIDDAIRKNEAAAGRLDATLPSAKNSDSVVTLGALQNNGSERAKLYEMRLRLADMLAQGQTYNTHVISAIQVGEKPVFPRKSVFGIGGLIIGLLLGVFVATLRRKT